jgi:cation diffusion facilitator CzcD-associated flavoprotein CzcO
VTTHFDVIIVGAGISGVCAAYHLQRSLPGKSFTILEARAAIGGTWDLFRYPGIRSDSDMYTLGFPWRPWQKNKLIADGESIRQYVEDSARENSIDEKIRFGVRVQKLSWSSERNSWTIECETGEGRELYTCGFVFMCAGYYSYKSGYTPRFKGMSDFAGRIVHPQFWSDEIEYAGKRVIVIGSGATAMSLVPALAEKAAHVTMLQRSPSYVFSAPSQDPVVKALRARLSPSAAYRVARWLSVVANAGFYKLTRVRPKLANRFLLNRVRKALGPSYDVEQHFTPRYNVWDQRVCLIPDADLFRALLAGRASVVTDHIDRFSARGIKLESGQELEADLIVTATGIELQMLGGAEVEIDGWPLEISEALTYKGCLFSDVPNLAQVFGYINASWTLKADLTSKWLCRLLEHMDRHGARRCVPRRIDPTITPEPMLNLMSGYVARAVGRLPYQGSKWPFKNYQNYILDFLSIRLGKIDDGTLEFTKVSQVEDRNRPGHRASAP